MIYTIFVAREHPSPRVLLQMSLILIWGCRLSWNLWLKGGYSLKFEDYRWDIIRREWIPNPVLLQLFNLVFVAILQNIILMMITSPVYYVSIVGNGNELKIWDYLLFVVGLVLLGIEATADWQQRVFRLERDRRKAGGKIMRGDEYDVGFVQRGLWRFSRHPNFFAGK